MREPEPSSTPRPAEPPRPAVLAPRSSVRINELPDAYPTAKGVAPPPLILEPVAIPVVAVAEPDSPLAFEGMSAPPRTRPKPPRGKSRWIRRALWTAGAFVAAVAVFFIGMTVGERRAAKRYEAALNKVDSPAVAAVGPKREGPATDRKKIADLKAAATPPKTTEPAAAAPRPADPTQAGSAVTFNTHVLPILQAKCVVCHGGQAKKGELDVRTVASLKKGGENGAAVVPGDLNASVLWEFVSNNKMPPGKSSKLTADEKKVIQDWIAGGAK